MSTETIEETEPIDTLALYTAEYRWSDTQEHRWHERKVFAAKAIELHQAGDVVEPREWHGSYGSALAKRSWYVVVDGNELADVALDYADLVTLVRHSTGFDFPRIDPGLRGNKHLAWQPTTALGHLLQEMAHRVPFYPALTEES